MSYPPPPTPKRTTDEPDLPRGTPRVHCPEPRSEALIISTVVMAVLILAAGVLGRFLLEPDDTPDQIVATVGVTNSASPLTEDLEAAGLTVIDVQGPAEDILTANEDLNAVIAAEPSRPQIFALDGAQHLDFITEATESAAGSYVLTDTFGDQATPEAKAYLADAQNLSVETFSANEFDPIVFIVGLITVSLVYGVIVMGVSMLATGVVEEKSSRVVEILLATIKPRDLLMGKFLGIGGAIFLMVAVYTAAIVGAGAIAGILPDINITTYVPMLLLWVVLGYIIYASNYRRPRSNGVASGRHWCDHDPDHFPVDRAVLLRHVLRAEQPGLDTPLTRHDRLHTVLQPVHLADPFSFHRGTPCRMFSSPLASASSRSQSWQHWQERSARTLYPAHRYPHEAHRGVQEELRSREKAQIE